MATTHYGIRGLSTEQMDKQLKHIGTRSFRTTKGYLTMCGIRVRGERIVSIRQSVDCEHCSKILAQYNSSLSNAVESMNKDTGV